MREIDTIIIHHAAGELSFNDVLDMHTKPKKKGGRGWGDIGYHFYIEPVYDSEDAMIIALRVARPLEKIGAHDFGENVGSIGICLWGDWREVKFIRDEDGLPVPIGLIARRMWRQAILLCYDLKRQYPKIRRVLGHKENEPKSTPTACPGFDPELFRLAVGFGWDGIRAHDSHANV